MAEVAGRKVAEMYPKTLLKMMDVLGENGIRSWQIYNNTHSIDLRIRFYPECRAMAVSDNVYVEGSEAARISTQPGSFTRKSPSHTKNVTHADA